MQEISAINELTSDFELDILFSEIWHDSRLSFENFPLCRHNITLKKVPCLPLPFPLWKGGC